MQVFKLSLLLILIGCSINKTNQSESFSTLTPDSCLESIDTKNLNIALAQCNQVIDKYKNSPNAYNNRALIYSLMGNREMACNDAKIASTLLKLKDEYTDPLTMYEIEIRQKLCKHNLNIDASD